MNKIKNLRELELFKEKLKYREKLMEKELMKSSADLVDHFSDKLKDFAFDLGMRMVWLFFKEKKRNKSPSD